MADPGGRGGGGALRPGASPSPRPSPRTSRRLQQRVDFYENVWSGGPATPGEDAEGRAGPIVDVGQVELRLAEERRSRRPTPAVLQEAVRLRPTPTSSPRGTSPLPPFEANLRRPLSPEDASLEETYERMDEEGDLVTGQRVVTVERVSLRRSVREVSRTPSEDHLVEDSAYQSRRPTEPSASSGLLSPLSAATRSVSSSQTSLSGQFPSEENIAGLARTPSRERLGETEWYVELHHTESSRKYELYRRTSQYDKHIHQIRGGSILVYMMSRDTLTCRPIDSPGTGLHVSAICTAW